MVASGFAPPGSKRRNQNCGGPGRSALDSEALRWRILVDPPSSGPHNMAVDHALAACSSPGKAVVRIYRWSCPTVSFGRNEPARDRYDRAAGHSAAIEFVRRPTGGRAVLHDRELTYAVVLPCPTTGGLRETYGLIHRGLVEALCSLGVPAAMAAGRGLSVGPDSGPCFDEPAPGEVTVAGRKLVGSAQARLEGGVTPAWFAAHRCGPGAATRTGFGFGFDICRPADGRARRNAREGQACSGADLSRGSPGPSPALVRSCAGSHLGFEGCGQEATGIGANSRSPSGSNP